MAAILENIQNRILVPLYHFQKKYLSREMASTACKKTANFIFKRSTDTAFILLALNAISTITSHLAQIGGLKKNKRDNSDYLINQEWQELGLDIVFTIIPPFILNNFLMKKLDSGQWTTRSERKNLLFTIAPTVGATQDDLYNTQHIVPLKETLGGYLAKILERIKKGRTLPPRIDKIIKQLEKNRYIKIPDINKQIPMANMENVTTDFDVIRKKAFSKFHNGSAYDEICGQRNGILIMAAIAYTVLASAIITPIIKNKLSNRSYKKHLEKEKVKNKDIKNKILDKINIERNDSKIFELFADVDKSLQIPLKNERIKDKLPNKQDIFNSFNTFRKTNSQSSSLRI